MRLLEGNTEQKMKEFYEKNNNSIYCKVENEMIVRRSYAAIQSLIEKIESLGFKTRNLFKTYEDEASNQSAIYNNWINGGQIKNGILVIVNEARGNSANLYISHFPTYCGGVEIGGIQNVCACIGIENFKEILEFLIARTKKGLLYTGMINDEYLSRFKEHKIPVTKMFSHKNPNSNNTYNLVVFNGDVE